MNFCFFLHGEKTDTYLCLHERSIKMHYQLQGKGDVPYLYLYCQTVKYNLNDAVACDETQFHALE